MEVEVENVGARPGSEVVQVYVAPPGGGGRHPAGRLRPVKQLKGFAKAHLAPGERRALKVTLVERSFAYYDVADAVWPEVMARYQGRDPDQSMAALHRPQAGWYVDAGRYEVLVGRSSADIAVSLPLDVEGGTAPLGVSATAG